MQRFERLRMTESELGKAWSSLPTHNAVQGSCRLPCFAKHKGMLNRPREQPGCFGVIFRGMAFHLRAAVETSP
jgi:hypothetical protein